MTDLVLQPRNYRDDYVNFTDEEFYKLDGASQRVLSSRVRETKASYRNMSDFNQYAAECVRVLGLRLEIPSTRVHLANRIVQGENSNSLRNDIIGFLRMSAPESPMLNEI
jgi:hypothetical protein